MSVGVIAAPVDPWVLPLDGSQELSHELVGGKAWSVNRLAALGIPTPPAAAMTIAACRVYLSTGSLPEHAWEQLLSALQAIERASGRTFGGSTRPLLLSVRSGAARSMPGMMDTVLNLGLNDAVQSALARESGDSGFAADTRRRFEADFLNTVLADPQGSVPADPWQQLRKAVHAVFNSWHSARARVYREHQGLSHEAGTAVTVQAMVFGNLDDRSGTGVIFSRNPASGEPLPMGEWLPRAQGEDIVSGRRTPQPIESMQAVLPGPYRDLLAFTRRLEQDARDVQDVEFTVEAGRLWLLQCRSAKRSARAALRLAVSLCEEGLISKAEAVQRLTPEQVRSLREPRLDPDALAGALQLAAGTAACPGLATGQAVMDSESAVERGEHEDVILVCRTTSPEDIHGMLAARGIVTALGGATSHAAVVSREIGVPCVVGCGEAVLELLKGRRLTVDGQGGRIFDGLVRIAAATPPDDPDLRRFTAWAREQEAAPPSLLAALQAAT
jgi:pyruvate, orthophosphate dikinase